MPIDTRDRRFSLMGFDLPVPRVLPNPDGALSAGDRQQHLFKYPGIAFAAPPGAPTNAPWMPTYRRRRR